MSIVTPFRDRKQQNKKPVASTKNYYDYALLAVIIMLVCFGLVMLYSASSYEAANGRLADDMYYFRRQLMISLFSLGIAIAVSFVDYHIFIAFSKQLYWVAMILMLMVKITPFGVTINGARRWLRLGVQFQPSEVAKIAIILFMSYIIIETGKDLKNRDETLKIIGWAVLPAIGAWKLTDNLSTGIIIGGIGVMMVYLAHPKQKPFLLALAGIIIVVAIALIIIKNAAPSGSGGFRMARIAAWLNKEDFASDEGYQVMQGLYAIGRGGFLGQGLGNSTQKLSTIPEAQNDMIFTIICEELGLFGALIVLILFVYLLYRLLVIAQNAPDLYGSLIASGIFVHIALQVILNIAVVLYVIPTTGVTLPFISYGGTSVLFLMFEMGLALSVSKRIKIKDIQ